MRVSVEAKNGGLINRFRGFVTGFAPLLVLAGAAISQPASAENMPSFDAAGAAAAPAEASAPQDFKSLFQSWKRMDGAPRQTISVPSAKPVSGVTFTSSFGIRSDPFRGSAAMHAGIDLAGPIGTPVYATADGYVGRADWANGYGNLVELQHGKGISTRYGHLSKILVGPGRHVKRGDLIALMGSTGRSTGSHLHYEVRLDGRAVNPVPFIQSADYIVAMKQRALGTQVAQVAQGGPLIPAGNR